MVFFEGTDEQQRYFLPPEQHESFARFVQALLVKYQIAPERYAAELERATTTPQGPERAPYTRHGDAEVEAVYQCLRSRDRGFTCNAALGELHNFLEAHNLLPNDLDVPARY